MDLQRRKIERLELAMEELLRLLPYGPHGAVESARNAYYSCEG